MSLESLEQTRLELIRTIHKQLSEDDKAFILSIKSGAPKWELFAYPDAKYLPVVRWKLHNLSGMNKAKQKSALKKLEDILREGSSL